MSTASLPGLPWAPGLTKFASRSYAPVAAADEELVEPEAVPIDGPIPVSALPRPRVADPNDESTKYLGFIPHSGYHNQRIALENALLLGFLLNRTV